ncbi:TPA: hydroxymyristoyl-ACP dehydratase [Serratia marcescens]|jgi:3-hydroxymyristoyl/3-hydroxydecanoyl-(acyl carrier protein) dehydratase|uniref:Acyl carrier protein dehydratase n=2 Tax=Serratia TaxID=613 RepID=A0ABC9IN43_SERMA|nr:MULTISPECIES: hydroxymyristoyl-ACP dehydratase [Serratia]MDI6929931.1 hydroxymyristoyl-ACP dehydratase [Serratia sp. Se-PFBMAAmG]QHI80064.1 hydroxymyristoyl-ACP dehydratase [Serratia sp. NGAS9]EMB2736242.1 hydroxymyristoyl-ACP dehydratase [Serratia marcescens]MBH2535799.1 hydroxymyristoyl-ACP dehydratase [Serratia marcescens]MBH2625693.1 hydroxymyristoyl-ACP dehydratase [Serratia marcescens]
MTPHKIECHQPQPGQAEITFSLEPELFWFKGHFAVQPLLPGVAQLDWVMHFSAMLLTPGFYFHSIQNVKFQAPLLPENRVTLRLNWHEERGSLTFAYLRHDGATLHTASSGKIRLCR